MKLFFNAFIMTTEKNDLKKQTPARIISGKKGSWIRIRLIVYIFRQVLRMNLNPTVAFREVQRIRRFRASANGNRKITRFIRSEGKYYWSADYPGMPSRNLKHALLGELARNSPEIGKQNPGLIHQQTVIWGITNRCPLRCRHCYDWDNIDKTDHLSRDHLKCILEKIEKQGIRHVQLSGGEPLMRFDDMLYLIGKASANIDFWLLTSGFGLTAEKAVDLKRAGLKGANISLDHWKEEEHNHFRNHPESYKWVLNAVESCRQAGIMVSLSVCATREFVSEENLTAYAELARDHGVHFIRILEPRETGHFAGRDVHLRPHEIDLLSRFAIRVNSEPEYRDYPIISFFGYHQRRLGCMGAGNRYLYIDANGDFQACPFCRGRVANALKDSFNEGIERLRMNGCHAFRTVQTFDEKSHPSPERAENQTPISGAFREKTGMDATS